MPRFLFSDTIYVKIITFNKALAPSWMFHCCIFPSKVFSENEACCLFLSFVPLLTWTCLWLVMYWLYVCTITSWVRLWWVQCCFSTTTEGNHADDVCINTNLDLSPSTGQAVIPEEAASCLNTDSPCWSAFGLFCPVTAAVFWLDGGRDVSLLLRPRFPPSEPISLTGVPSLWSPVSLPPAWLPPLLHPSPLASLFSSSLSSDCSLEWINSREAATAFLPEVSWTDSAGPPWVVWWPPVRTGLGMKLFRVLSSAWESKCCCCSWAWRSARNCEMASRRSSKSLPEWCGMPSLQEVSGTSWSDRCERGGRLEADCWRRCWGWSRDESEWTFSGKIEGECSDTESLWLSCPPRPVDRGEHRDEQSTSADENSSTWRDNKFILLWWLTDFNRVWKEQFSPRSPLCYSEEKHADFIV